MANISNELAPVLFVVCQALEFHTHRKEWNFVLLCEAGLVQDKRSIGLRKPLATRIVGERYTPAPIKTPPVSEMRFPKEVETSMFSPLDRAGQITGLVGSCETDQPVGTNASVRMNRYPINSEGTQICERLTKGLGAPNPPITGTGDSHASHRLREG